MVQIEVRSYGLPTHLCARWQSIPIYLLEDPVTAMELPGDDSCHDCRRRVLSAERDASAQRKTDDLQAFLSHLRIKEGVPVDGVCETEDAAAEAAFSGQGPRHAAQVAAQVFANFEERIRDCGCGRTYLYAPILPASGGMVDAVVLSAWDNIVGPKAVFVWSGKAGAGRKLEGAEEPDGIREAVRYTVSHTLHGELDKMNCGSVSAHGLELYVVEDCGFVVSSVPFMARQAQESVPYSLSVITPASELKRALEYQSLFNLWMQRLACCLRVSLYQKDYKTALAELSPNIVDFCELLGSLSTAGLTFVRAVADIELERRLLKPILGKAITSHLQTCCCTVVISDSIQEVNCVVRVLADFLRPQDRALVRLVVEDTAWPYHPGLLVQGMLKGVRGDANISEEDVLCNMYPTTIVDLSQYEVRQSWLLHEHARHRTTRLKHELSALLSNSKPYSAVMQNIFHRVSDVSPLVNEFLEKIWPLECDVQRRQGLIALFLRKLEYHAFALIRLVQAVSRLYGSSPELHPQPVNRKSLRQQLNLEDEADFLVVLAVAERLQPGTYYTVMQDGGAAALHNDTRDSLRN